MFRKQDFKKVDLLGSGKKNTKIYKVLHLSSGKYYALKEVEAKTLDKLNEYKVRLQGILISVGRSSAIIQSLEPPEHHLVLRLFLL
jgi:serine/threonine protein kinase